MDGQLPVPVKWRRKIAENFNRVGHTNVTDRRLTDGRQAQQHIANVNSRSRSLKNLSRAHEIPSREHEIYLMGTR